MITLSGEIRSVNSRKDKEGKILNHQYQVETSGSRIELYDLMEWGAVQNFSVGQKIVNVPVRVKVSSYSGDVEFSVAKNGNGSTSTAKDSFKKDVKI
jgi:hypothetical protein